MTRQNRPLNLNLMTMAMMMINQSSLFSHARTKRLKRGQLFNDISNLYVLNSLITG